jgi:hypothetical protein
MHERKYSQARQPLKTGPRDLDLRLAFGQHALRFGKTRADERRRMCRRVY